MSNSLGLRGLQPASLLCPWDSPGKNTGVNCHSLLQGIFLTQGSNLCLLPLLCWQAYFLLSLSLYIYVHTHTHTYTHTHTHTHTQASLLAQMLKSPPAMQETWGLIPRLGKSGEGNGNLLQYSCLENPLHRGAWWFTIHGHNWVTNTYIYIHHILSIHLSLST